MSHCIPTDRKDSSFSEEFNKPSSNVSENADFSESLQKVCLTPLEVLDAVASRNSFSVVRVSGILKRENEYFRLCGHDGTKLSVE